MSNENKRAREQLERMYGKESFIRKLKLREKYGEGHTYMAKNQVRKAVWYRGQQLTYHHILEKSKGGKATVENGALLSADDHQWFHKQSKERQQEMNEAFQTYKRGIKVNAVEITTGGVKSPQQITFDELGVGYVEISLEDNTEEDNQFLETYGSDEVEYQRYLEQRRQRKYMRFEKQYKTSVDLVEEK